MFKEVGRLANKFRNRPHISIFEWGYSTESDTPHVSVSVISKNGSMTLFTYPDDDEGNATATMNARSLCLISGLPVVDHRKKPEL